MSLLWSLPRYVFMYFWLNWKCELWKLKTNNCNDVNKGFDKIEKTRFTPGSVIAILGFLHVLDLIHLNMLLTDFYHQSLGANCYQRIHGLQCTSLLRTSKTFWMTRHNCTTCFAKSNFITHSTIHKYSSNARQLSINSNTSQVVTKPN